MRIKKRNTQSDRGSEEWQRELGNFFRKLFLHLDQIPPRSLRLLSWGVSGQPPEPKKGLSVTIVGSFSSHSLVHQCMCQGSWGSWRHKLTPPLSQHGMLLNSVSGVLLGGVVWFRLWHQAERFRWVFYKVEQAVVGSVLISESYIFKNCRPWIYWHRDRKYHGWFLRVGTEKAQQVRSGEDEFGVLSLEVKLAMVICVPEGSSNKVL